MGKMVDEEMRHNDLYSIAQDDVGPFIFLFVICVKKLEKNIVCIICEFERFVVL